MVLAKPKPFKRTRGAADKSFFGQILLHAITYPDQFPTESSKVSFVVSCMTDYAATWSQPYLMRVFNAEEVVFDEFRDDFRSIFFDQNHQKCAEVALQSLHKTGTVSAYTQDFNSHACTVGWADTPLMSLWQNGLDENIQLAVVMSNILFTTLQNMQAMALKAGQTVKGIWNCQPSPIPPASSAPTTNPNEMDLSAFQCGPPNLLEF
ncbi:uncharacterized protein VP01_4415g1 [Puccinia sorghi]|uniref:Retrotransposon gag domain-containing protein n=1 Tax=Puccinia sorghi TaxID=27349 RepID=A0A0L6UPL2_9BASI|nr:uncharacterized protein VP01_4415g1 [Puccinia sorghi]